MEEIGSGEAEVHAAEKIKKVEPEKKVGKTYDEELGQLKDDADISDKAVKETLDKDQLKGVRENSAVKPNGEDVSKVKETDSGKVTVVTAMESREVETSHDLTVVLDPPSMVEHNSLSKAASSTQGLSLVSSTPTQEPKSGSRNVNSLSVSPVLRTPARDGYNWRKYGQKQVKSPKGSRSYYRCTYSDCCAKKIECSNDLGNVIEIVNKGSHSHEPPRKNNLSVRESKIVPYSLEDTLVARDQSTSAKDNICESRLVVERKRLCSSVSGGHGENETEEEPEPKRRLKKDNLPSSDSGSRPGKKHKFVVHAAGDVGISGDGYRWRKYGQKMVKGNPNPRNYYRCTSAGCPVRKHIETAVENTTAVIITYKGVHNHDMPVPKKRHGPPSSVLVAAAAPTSMRTRPDDQVTTTQCIAGRESEQSSEPMDVGGEKVMESARTLLSIGFEIKQC